MLIKNLVRRALPKAVGFQFIHECVVGAKAVKAKNGTPPHTRVEFATNKLQPGDVLRPANAQYVGVIVWIPTDEYTRLADQ